MAKRISEDIKEKIRLSLLHNTPVRDIAEEFNVSEKSIQRIKKDMPEVKDIPINTLSDEHYNTYYNKRELQIIDKIDKEIALFEDEEEGWTYHVTDLNERNKQRGIWWSCIVYPESAPSNWIELLKCRGYSIAISPLHDKDTWNHDSPEYIDIKTGKYYKKGERYKVGDRKKAHWHVIITLEKPCSYREMNHELQKLLNCPYIQKCRSIKNSYEYFLHINAPEKYQGYLKEDIQTYNNFRIEPNKFEIGLITQDIVITIREQDIDTFSRLVEYFENDIEYLLIITNKANFFNAHVKSRYYLKHPNDVKKTEVKVVKTFSDEVKDNG